MLRRLAGSGLQARAPRRMVDVSTGKPADVINPPVDEFPMRLKAATDHLDLLLDSTSDDPRLLPTRRPSSSDRATWLEELRDFGRARRLKFDEYYLGNIVELIVTFDPDWPLAAQWQPLPAPETLIVGDPSKVSEPTRVAGHPATEWAGWHWHDTGRVEPWLEDTVRSLEFYCDLIIERRRQYAAAKTLLAAAAQGMSGQHRKAWSDIRFLAKGQVESLMQVITTIAQQLYAEISGHKVLTASYIKSTN